MHTPDCISGVQAAERRVVFDELLARVPRTGKRAFGNKRSATHTHQGVDLGAPRGFPITSLVRGTVTHASDTLAEGFSGYGRHVVVRQGDAGPYLLVAHLEEVNVAPGDSVEFGELLGSAGDSCFDKADPSKACNGVHVHFEVSDNAYPQTSEAPRLDPVAWLEAERGRLAAAVDEETKPDPKRRKKPALAKRAKGGIGGGLAVVVSFAVLLLLVAVAVKARGGSK